MLSQFGRTALITAALAFLAQGCGVNKFEICPDCEQDPADAGGPIIDGGATVDGDGSRQTLTLELGERPQQ